MVLTATTWFFLITSSIITFFALGYGILMGYTFLKKRTLGTAFLMLAFSLLGIGEASNAIAYWLGAFEAAATITLGILQSFFVNLYVLSIIFFYFFSTRHILLDNDFVKAVTGVIFGEITAVITTTMFTVLILGHDLFFKTTQEFIIADTNLYNFAPSVIFSLIIFIPLIIIILGRILLNLFIIRRKIVEPVSKIGITFIGLSVLSIFGSTTVLLMFYIPNIYAISGLMVFLQTLRVIATIVRLISGYIGWTLPEWLKRLVRKKVWIVKILKEKENEIMTYAYSSSHKVETEKNLIKEINES